MITRRLRLLAGFALGAVRKLLSKVREQQETERMLTRARERVAEQDGIAGRRVLVTGSTRGIGRALAEAFVEQGASVVVHGRRESEARELADRLRARARPGTVVVGVGADLAEPGSGTVLAERAIEALGGIDLVVNNAGLHDPVLKPVWETSTDEMSSTMRVNALAAFEVCTTAMAHMVEHGVAGRVITMSTVVARTDHLTSGGVASYAVSKMALEGLTHYLAVEGGPHGITVTCVRPVEIDTEMVAPFYPLDKRLRMWPADSLVAPVVHLATAPPDEVHGRIFDQPELMETLGGKAS